MTEMSISWPSAEVCQATLPVSPSQPRPTPVLIFVRGWYVFAEHIFVRGLSGSFQLSFCFCCSFFLLHKFSIFHYTFSIWPPQPKPPLWITITTALWTLLPGLVVLIAQDTPTFTLEGWGGFLAFISENINMICFLLFINTPPPPRKAAVLTQSSISLFSPTTVAHPGSNGQFYRFSIAELILEQSEEFYLSHSFPPSLPLSLFFELLFIPSPKSFSAWQFSGPAVDALLTLCLLVWLLL